MNDEKSKRTIFILLVIIVILIFANVVYGIITGPKSDSSLDGEVADDLKNSGTVRIIEKNYEGNESDDDANVDNEVTINNNSVTENNSNTSEGLFDFITKKTLECPTSGVAKIYNGTAQSSGIMCPAGSEMSGNITAKYVGKYVQKCIPKEGYRFKKECKIEWTINHSSTKGTITYHKNIPGDNSVAVVSYDKNVSLSTFYIPNNWTRKGYVFAGWAEDPKATTPKYSVSNDLYTSLLRENSYDCYSLYAVWVPVNNTYGNVVFIGDSYVNSSEWTLKVANKLGLNGSYTTVYMPGSGFYQSVPGHGGLGSGKNVNFSSFIAYADQIIGDNSTVKNIIIAGGYNDYLQSYESVKNSIIVTAKGAHERFPNATIYIAMIGTNFTNLKIESDLLTYAEKAYEDAAASLPYLKNIPYKGQTTSISNYLRWFGDYEGARTHGCDKNRVTSSCYYWIENEVVAGKNVTHTIHASTTSGEIIADSIVDYIKNH